MSCMGDENKSEYDHKTVPQQFSLRSRYDLPQVGDSRLGIDPIKTQSAADMRQRSRKQITHQLQICHRRQSKNHYHDKREEKKAIRVQIKGTIQYHGSLQQQNRDNQMRKLSRTNQYSQVETSANERRQQVIITIVLIEIIKIKKYKK